MELKAGYKLTEVGVIPEDWEEKRISDVAELNPESLSSSTSPDYAFKYIALEDVCMGNLVCYSKQVFSNSPSRARRVIQQGDHCCPAKG